MVLVQTTLQGTIADVETLNRNLDITEVRARRVNSLLRYMVSMFVAMGLPKDIQAQGRLIVRGIALLEQFRIAWSFTAATTPIALLYAIPMALGVGATAMAAIGDVNDAMRGNTR